LTVAIEKHYGIVINDAEIARQAMQSLGTLRRWLAQQPGPDAKP
jgi:acyl carrier protein